MNRCKCRSYPPDRSDDSPAEPIAKWVTFQELYDKHAVYPNRVVTSWLGTQADQNEAYAALRSSPKVSMLRFSAVRVRRVAEAIVDFDTSLKPLRACDCVQIIQKTLVSLAESG